MIDKKYTPAPWVFVKANPSPTSGERLIRSEKPGYLAEVRDCGSGCADANARLIAAAPELYEALELMVSTYREGGWPSSSITIACAVLKKARGI